MLGLQRKSLVYLTALVLAGSLALAYCWTYMPTVLGPAMWLPPSQLMDDSQCRPRMPDAVYRTVEKACTGTIAFVTVATRKGYFDMAEELAASISRHVCGGDASLVVLTDQPVPASFANFSCSMVKETKYAVCGPHVLAPWKILDWPESTLQRFEALLSVWPDVLVHFDYVYWMDADQLVASDFCDDIKGTRVGMGHMHFLRRDSWSPLDSNWRSTAYVPADEKYLNPYYSAHLYGGLSSEMCQLVLDCKAGVDVDRANGVVARWHDESHLNRYLIAHPPTITLGMSFTCFVEAALDQSVFAVGLDSRRMARKASPCFIVARLKDAKAMRRTED